MLTLSRDINGNKTLKYKPSTGKGFSIRTNGNLPTTHRMTNFDFNPHIALTELKAYVHAYGTSRQKSLVGWD
jgi:hypothetical protein